MIDHVSLGSRNYAESVTFYARALAPLGITLQRDTGKEAAFGRGDDWMFFIYPAADDATVTAPGMHVAFRADSRDMVAQVHADALAAHGLDILTPRMRPDISSTYFGAMFHDLDGHRIEVKTDAP